MRVQPPLQLNEMRRNAQRVFVHCANDSWIAATSGLGLCVCVCVCALCVYSKYHRQQSYRSSLIHARMDTVIVFVTVRPTPMHLYIPRHLQTLFTEKEIRIQYTYACVYTSLAVNKMYVGCRNVNWVYNIPSRYSNPRLCRNSRCCCRRRRNCQSACLLLSFSRYLSTSLPLSLTSPSVSSKYALGCDAMIVNKCIQACVCVCLCGLKAASTFFAAPPSRLILTHSDSDTR